MNKSALTKHHIYNNLTGLNEQDLGDVAKFIDFMRYKKQVAEKKAIKLQGILKNYDIDFSCLKEFKKNAWEHLEEEFDNE